MEVYNVKHGAYARQNQYWSCYGLQGMIAEIAVGDKSTVDAQAKSIGDSFDRLSPSDQKTRTKVLSIGNRVLA